VRRRLFTFFSALSLLLCLTLCVLSVPTGDGVPTVELLRVPTKNGHFMVDSTRMGVSAYASDRRSANDFVLKKPLGVRVFDVPLDNHSLRGVTIPHWMLVLPLAVLPLWWLKVVHRQRRRAKRLAAGQCEACGYDLRESPERCPECGRKAA
jgi:hypothetical protein